MKLILAVALTLLSAFLIAAGVWVGVDSALVFVFGRDSFVHGSTAAWELAVASACLTVVGGNVASLTGGLLSVEEA